MIIVHTPNHHNPEEQNVLRQKNYHSIEKMEHNSVIDIHVRRESTNRISWSTFFLDL
jgi:hypothetical protein